MIRIEKRLGWWLAAGLAAAVLAAAAVYQSILPQSAPPASSPAGSTAAQPRPGAAYIGASACRQCHESEFNAWSGSHHQLAMQEASGQAVLGDFDDAAFSHAGITSRFFRRDGRFMVRTDGPDGRLADFEVRYAFGVWPLQQYLIEFPGGRYQALAIAWDARAKSEGGQRWFHLSPNEKIDHRDPLHWTGLYQNWNLQCAACHSTNLKKGYDAASNTYRTTFSEINVACEACHGPGSLHADWGRSARAPYPPGSDKGLVVLRTDWNSMWKFAAQGAASAQREQRPGAAAIAAMNTCAACHARRSVLSESGTPGAPLEDTHRQSLLTEPNYYADGQQREEVYVWGSFLQTRMFQRGVTCMDCHDPHALKLRAQGNALCLRCHAAAVFDTGSHHFHAADSKGAQCVECHMPARDYMVIDMRRDHAIRVPRPDLSILTGSPNACTGCHADRKPEWAAAVMDQRYGKAWRNRTAYGATLHAASAEGQKALPSLLALAGDPASPSIVRATAAALAQPYVRPEILSGVRGMLANVDPALRIAALGLLEPFEAATRAQAAAPLLADPVRGVRVEAARLLADLPDAQIPGAHRDARGRALDEYVAALQQDADWPTANASLGNLRMRQGRLEDAIAAYERALALDARFAAGYVNLADAYRQAGREAEAEKLLRRGLVLLPRAADLHHALGLLLVRRGDREAAFREIAAAAKLAPGNARYAYVHAVGLHSAGRRDAALAALRAADARHPYNLDILGALVSINREAGNAAGALPYARKIAEALPEDPNVKRMLADLEGKAQAR